MGGAPSRSSATVSARRRFGRVLRTGSDSLEPGNLCVVVTQNGFGCDPLIPLFPRRQLAGGQFVVRGSLVIADKVRDILHTAQNVIRNTHTHRTSSISSASRRTVGPS